MPRIDGLSKVLRNLNKAVKKIEDRSTSGLIRAGVEVRKEGMRETPVDTGNLINSWFGPVVRKVRNGSRVYIGLQAKYAPYVHENTEAHFQKPGAKSKFLEDPLKRNAKNIARWIRGGR